MAVRSTQVDRVVHALRDALQFGIVARGRSKESG